MELGIMLMMMMMEMDGRIIKKISVFQILRIVIVYL